MAATKSAAKRPSRNSIASSDRDAVANIRKRELRTMRTAVKKTLAAALAAVTLSLAVAGPTPASAHTWVHGGYHGHGGFWGPGVALGVFGLAAGAIAASQYDCVRYTPVYDAYGNYIGQRPVNVC
jgi:hypothetical protein